MAHLLPAGEAAWLCTALLLLLLVSRAASVLPIVLAHNCMAHTNRLSATDIVIIW